MIKTEKVNANKIVVYGGTGYYGRSVVKRLINKGESIRVVSRNRESAKKIFSDNVDIFQGDVTNIETIIRSLEGVDRVVICLSAMSRKLIRQMKAIEGDAVFNIIEEAEKAGISRLVYMSGYEMREQLLKKLKITDFGAIKIAVETKIAKSSLNWTILGDAPAYEIFFAFLKNGRMTVPGGGFKAIPSISAEDVGEITAQTILRDDLNRQRLKLTGPHAYSFPEVAAIISEISGRKVKHIAIPLSIINIVSFVLIPFIPFVRYLYKSLIMLNNFPEDLANEVPEEHKKLIETFKYESVTMEMEIQKRMKG